MDYIQCIVASEWVLPEEDCELAEALLDRGAALRAPAFVFVELANARSARGAGFGPP